MIIEFAGVPGAGKTTIANAVCDRLRRQNLPVSQPTATVSHEYSPPRRILSKSLSGINGCVADPKFMLRVTDLLATIHQQRVRMYVKNLFNMSYIRGLYNSASQNTMTVLDQGLLQGLWSIAYFARDRFDPQQHPFQFLLDYPHPIRFVLIEAPFGVTSERLADRKDSGHPTELEELVHQSARSNSHRTYERVRETAEEIANLAPTVSVQTFTNIESNDVNRISEELTNQLVQSWRGYPKI